MPSTADYIVPLSIEYSVKAIVFVQKAIYKELLAIASNSKSTLIRSKVAKREFKQLPKTQTKVKKVLIKISFVLNFGAFNVKVPSY